MYTLKKLEKEFTGHLIPEVEGEYWVSVIADRIVFMNGKGHYYINVENTVMNVTLIDGSIVKYNINNPELFNDWVWCVYDGVVNGEIYLTLIENFNIDKDKITNFTMQFCNKVGLTDEEYWSYVMFIQEQLYKYNANVDETRVNMYLNKELSLYLNCGQNTRFIKFVNIVFGPVVSSVIRSIRMFCINDVYLCYDERSNTICIHAQSLGSSRRIEQLLITNKSKYSDVFDQYVKII